jgi:hypothetical protein
MTCVAFSALSCSPDTVKPSPQAPKDEDLGLTLGGFREGRPDEGELNGICTGDSTRTVLNCDVYNGLKGWTVSEFTLMITWYPYKDDDKRSYAEHVSIEPMETNRASIKLGLQLPSDTQLIVRGRPFGKPQTHWGWSIVSAKGHRAR